MSRLLAEPPIFIAGAGRSGTTLLRSLLSAHSRIAVTPETHFLERVERVGGLDPGTPIDIEAFWSKYSSSTRFRDLGVDVDRCRQLIDQQGEPTFETIFSSLLAAYVERMEKQRVGEKTPRHVNYLPQLFSWFPEARVVIMRRDPRAVIASLLQSPWVTARLTPTSIRHGIVVGSRLHQVAHHARVWTKMYEGVVPSWERDQRVLVVSYESLVQDAEGQLRTICEFLGESFEPTMLTDRTCEAVPLAAGTSEIEDDNWREWRQQHHVQTLRPISSESLGKWKNQLPKSEIAVIEGYCERGMRLAGYDPAATPRQRAKGRALAKIVPGIESMEARVRSAATSTVAQARRAKDRLGYYKQRLPKASVERGVPPSWFGYRWVQRETVAEYFTRCAGIQGAGRYETVHPEAIACNPLPCNVTSREDLPDERGWWGYSFWDVPERTSGETFIATVRNGRLVWYNDPAKGNDFYPAALTGDGRALDLREMQFRPLHAETLRGAGRPARLKRATWIIERVYHNHSHWLTAHLPKLLLLRERDGLGEVLLPPVRASAIDDSLRMIGLEPEEFRTFDAARPLVVEELTILGTDRFRPELLRLVPQAYGVLDAPPPHRKVYISRARASRRRLVNEDEIWPLLEPLGFERVFMEECTFEQQVELMKETAVLIGPHGAGLTNMLFCPPGTHVVEIADLSFPNPNFYAVASAMRHRYWLLSAEALGDGHPLEKDLRIDVEAVEAVLPSLASTGYGLCRSSNTAGRCEAHHES